MSSQIQSTFWTFPVYVEPNNNPNIHRVVLNEGEIKGKRRAGNKWVYPYKKDSCLKLSERLDINKTFTRLRGPSGGNITGF